MEHHLLLRLPPLSIGRVGARETFLSRSRSRDTPRTDGWLSILRKCQASSSVSLEALVRYLFHADPSGRGIPPIGEPAKDETISSRRTKTTFVVCLMERSFLIRIQRNEPTHPIPIRRQPHNISISRLAGSG